jgi:outer membrane protein assembly factor BamB
MKQLLALLMALLASPAFADNWPEFRGPTADGHASAKKLPTKWSETTNVRWKTEIHDKGWASPVIWGEHIWLTTAHKDGKAFYAICVDRQTGKVLHDLKLFEEEKPAFCHPFNSYASSTPVIEAGRVYLHFGSHGTYCLNTANGAVLWKRHDLKCDHFRGPGSSPIIWKNLLILTFDGFDKQYLAALNKETGETVWLKDRNIKYTVDNGDYKKAYSTPAVTTVNGQTQIISPSAESTIAYNPENGDELWRLNHGGMNASSRPLVANGLIYLTSGHTMNLIALKQGGTGLLQTEAIAWKNNKEAPTRPSLILVGDFLYYVNDNGIARCVDAKTGKPKWQERLDGQFSTSPIYAAGNIYFLGENGKSFVIAAEPTYKLIERNQLDAGCMASPAVSGEELFIRTKTHLYCISEKK